MRLNIIEFTLLVKLRFLILIILLYVLRNLRMSTCELYKDFIKTYNIRRHQLGNL